MSSPEDRILKKVRRRRTEGLRAYHILALLLLLPFLLLPNGSGYTVSSGYALPAEPWASESYGSETPERFEGSDIDGEETDVLAASAAVSRMPLHLPPVDAELTPTEFARVAGAIPLDRALWPHPPNRQVFIDSRRSTGRSFGGRSTTTVTFTTTTTAAAPAPVPEPGVGLTLTVAVAGAALRRRRSWKKRPN